MSASTLMADAAGELALFAAVGFLLFSLDDLLVDGIYFAGRLWRRGEWRDAGAVTTSERPGWLVVFIPAWDEAAVIGRMLAATLERFSYPDYSLLVGHYRNDPATAAAIREASARDGRVVPVEVPRMGPTTKADCLNHLYGIM